MRETENPVYLQIRNRLPGASVPRDGQCQQRTSTRADKTAVHTKQTSSLTRREGRTSRFNDVSSRRCAERRALRVAGISMRARSDTRAPSAGLSCDTHKHPHHIRHPRPTRESPELPLGFGDTLSRQAYVPIAEYAITTVRFPKSWRTIAQDLQIAIAAESRIAPPATSTVCQLGANRGTPIPHGTFAENMTPVIANYDRRVA